MAAVGLSRWSVIVMPSRCTTTGAVGAVAGAASGRVGVGFAVVTDGGVVAVGRGGGSGCVGKVEAVELAGARSCQTKTPAAAKRSTALKTSTLRRMVKW